MHYDCEENKISSLIFKNVENLGVLDKKKGGWLGVKEGKEVVGNGEIQIPHPPTHQRISFLTRVPAPKSTSLSPNSNLYEDCERRANRQDALLALGDISADNTWRKKYTSLKKKLNTAHSQGQT